MRPTEPPTPAPSGRVLLTLGALGVLLAAADTYVVVLALPEMMGAVDIEPDELHRAAPIISIFLLGYVAAVPLAGRLSDVLGRRVVLVGALGVFAVGSLVTATSTSLAAIVTGRLLQGAGGGALVPVALALVADLWPQDRRGRPLGWLGAAQELGALLGPLLGAAILAVSDWRAIFWLNLALGVALAMGCIGRVKRPRDLPAISLLVIAAAAGALALVRPQSWVEDVDLGLLFLPVVGESPWLSPLVLTVVGALVLFAARELTAARPLLDLRRLPRLAREVDLVGALLLGAALGGVVVTFAAADPAVVEGSPAQPQWLVVTVVAGLVYLWHRRSVSTPLVPHGSLSARPAWGALLVSLGVGAALVALVVGIPVLVRTATPGSDQLDAALVLMRFLVAVPVGAWLGGHLLHRRPAALVAAVGLASAAAALAVSASWDQRSLDRPWVTVVLVVAGLGFGVAIAPINAALLAATPPAAHGIASAFLVVARMTGMVVGLSVLTAVGLSRFAAARDDIPEPGVLCPDSPTDCAPYTDAVRDAAVAQVQAILAGGAVCAMLAAAVAGVLLIRPRT